MARLDDELAKSLREANDKLRARDKGTPAPVTHKRTVVKPTTTYGDGERPFSEVFGFMPPSGIDHVIPSFSHDSWHESVRMYIPNIDLGHVLPPDETESAVVAILKNKPLLIIGKKGSGKTSLQKQIAARMCLPWFRVNARQDMESSALFGTPSLEAGSLDYTDGPLVMFGMHGGLLTVDECSALPAGIALALQSPLERDGPIYVPDKPKGERYIQPHQWFRLAATDNTQLQGDTTGRYAGTNAQNEALIDRFLTTVKLDYLSRNHETDVILKHVPNVPDDWLEKMLDTAILIRRAYDTGNLNLTLSPRGLISWADDAVTYGDLARGFRLSVMNKLTEDDEKQVVELFLKATAIDLNKAV